MAEQIKGPVEKPTSGNTEKGSRILEKREPLTVRDTHKPPAPVAPTPGGKGK